MLVLLLALAAPACETPRERSIRRFVQGEIFSEELQIRIDIGEARGVAEQQCGGPVALPPYETGREPDDYVCIPPPASL
jgi:hypothetical protein